MNDTAASDSPTRADARDHLLRNLLLYFLARFSLVIAVGGVLMLFTVPLLVAAAVGIVVGLPVGLLVFRRLNERVTAGLAARNEVRARERAKLRAELRGESLEETARS